MTTEEIAGFAHRSDDFPDRRCFGARRHGHDVVPGAVERRPGEIVHRRVDDGEVLRWTRLQVLDAGQQQAGVAHQAAPGFEQNAQFSSGQAGEQRLQVVGNRGFAFVAIANAEPAAQIDMLQRNAVGCQLVDEQQDFVERFGKRCGIEQLRADMAVDAVHGNVGQAVGLTIKLARLGVGNAKLVLLQAGRDIRMGACVDVRVDAQADRRRLAQAPGDGVEALEFSGRFDVETEDAGGQRRGHFG